jgi:hypothetical protein
MIRASMVARSARCQMAGFPQVEAEEGTYPGRHDCGKSALAYIMTPSVQVSGIPSEP